MRHVNVRHAAGVAAPAAAPAAARLPWVDNLKITIVAGGERGWLGRIPPGWSRGCGRVAAAGLAGFSVLVAVTSLADGELAGFAVLEGVVAVTASLWLVAWFRRRRARQGRLAARASRGAYAAYVLHPPVLVLASLAARPLPLQPEAKFVLVAAAGVVVAFTVG